ncbi:MAG: alpha-ketoglutarate-dependent dioxygenase AlkB [Pseudomonadota bacterium]
MSSGRQIGFAFAEPRSSAEQIDLKDATVMYFPEAFSVMEADTLLDYCLHQLPWRQDALTIAGKRIPIPRLQNWFGDSGARYAYSGLALTPLPWTAPLLRVRQRAEALAGQSFNAVLANYYRDGKDSVGWHSDDERELGLHPVIASVSLGVTRVFEMKHAHDKSMPTLRLPLTHGSVLIMAGGTQEYWRHQLPKDVALTLPRVNLTFRKILI